MQFGWWAAACCGVGAAVVAEAASVGFSVNYIDAADTGFYDPTYGAARRTAFEYALGIWSSYLQASYEGETITIDATFTPLSGSETSAVLGSAGSQYVYGLNVVDMGTTVFGDALANHLYGSDINPVSPGDDPAEIVAQFNSEVDGSQLGSTDWYYGLDGQSGGHVDFVTVVLHEIGHGLNFFDTVHSGTGAYQFFSSPGIYDRYLYDASAGKRFEEMTNEERLAALTGGDLYWDGPAGIAANGGERPQIYAPNPYEPGSSISHLDETTFALALMSPEYDGPDHLVSDVELGMLADMGWNVVPEPGLIAVGAAGLTLLSIRRRAKGKRGA